MTLLPSILQGDRTDLELIQIALETLANVMSYEADNLEGKVLWENVCISKIDYVEQPNLPQDITTQFTGRISWLTLKES